MGRTPTETGLPAEVVVPLERAAARPRLGRGAPPGAGGAHQRRAALALPAPGARGGGAAPRQRHHRSQARRAAAHRWSRRLPRARRGLARPGGPRQLRHAHRLRQLRPRAPVGQPASAFLGRPVADAPPAERARRALGGRREAPSSRRASPLAVDFRFMEGGRTDLRPGAGSVPPSTFASSRPAPAPPRGSPSVTLDTTRLPSGGRASSSSAAATSTAAPHAERPADLAGRLIAVDLDHLALQHRGTP